MMRKGEKCSMTRKEIKKFIGAFRSLFETNKTLTLRPLRLCGELL